MSVLFSAYTADDSQKFSIDLDFTAQLLVDFVPANLPSHYTDPQIRARRLSLIMPTPTLDSRGRPT